MSTGNGNAEIGADMATTLNCNHEAPIVAHTLRKNYRNNSNPMSEAAMLVACPLTGNPHGDHESRESLLIPMALNLRGREGGAMPEMDTLANIRSASEGSSRSHVVDMSLRRLTPRECERLQGFPDDYTLVQYRGKPAADSPRYTALGNSMAVPVMRWIGERIHALEGAR